MNFKIKEFDVDLFSLHNILFKFVYMYINDKNIIG